MQITGRTTAYANVPAIAVRITPEASVATNVAQILRVCVSKPNGQPDEPPGLVFTNNGTDLTIAGFLSVPGRWRYDFEAINATGQVLDRGHVEIECFAIQTPIVAPPVASAVNHNPPPAPSAQQGAQQMNTSSATPWWQKALMGLSFSAVLVGVAIAVLSFISCSGLFSWFWVDGRFDQVDSKIDNTTAAVSEAADKNDRNHRLTREAVQTADENNSARHDDTIGAIESNTDEVKVKIDERADSLEALGEENLKYSKRSAWNSAAARKAASKPIKVELVE